MFTIEELVVKARADGASDIHLICGLPREEIPRLDSLGLPPAVLDLPKLHKGIVLVTGETGTGKDTRSFADGLRASLREDPDVILIGEMRDRDTIETAIATSSAIGGQTMDQALVRLVRIGTISHDTALHDAHDVEYMKKNAL